jgi:hypothetical protein
MPSPGIRAPWFAENLPYLLLGHAALQIPQLRKVKRWTIELDER